MWHDTSGDRKRSEMSNTSNKEISFQATSDFPIKKLPIIEARNKKCELLVLKCVILATVYVTCKPSLNLKSGSFCWSFSDVQVYVINTLLRTTYLCSSAIAFILMAFLTLLRWFFTRRSGGSWVWTAVRGSLNFSTPSRIRNMSTWWDCRLFLLILRLERI